MSDRLSDAVTFRKLWRQEAPLYAAHLRRLNAEDWRARFMGTTNRRFARRHVDRIDWARAVVLGAFVDGRLRGVAELQPLRCTPEPEAELAITVERRFQNRGIGSELMRRLITAARNRGIKKLQLVAQPDNGRMRSLIRKFSGELRVEPGTAEAEIPMLPASYATLLEESWQDTRGVGERLREALRPFGPERLPLLLLDDRKQAA